MVAATMNESTPPPAGPPSSPPPQAPPPPVPPLVVGGLYEKQWAMFLHLSQLLGFVMPGLGFAGPLVIWLVLKDRFAVLDLHGRMVTNWMISLLLYSAVAFAISVVTCGIGMVLFIPLMLLGIIFPIIGAVRANEGTLWKYPMTIPFLSGG